MSVHPWPAAIGAILSFSLLSGGGCQVETGCAEGTPCGGDPTGTWTVVNACRDPSFTAPIQPTYQAQPVALAHQPVPETTSSDWCSSVILGAQGLTSFVFPHDTLSVSGGQVTYGGDGLYHAVINTVGRGGVDLSASCLTRFGISVSCDAVAAALVDFAARVRQEPPVTCTDSPAEPATCQFFYAYDQISCVDDTHNGCACSYGVSFNGTFDGKWSTAGDRLIHFDASKMLPTQADYCADAAGGNMSLWGHARTALFDEAGLRMLKLQRTP